MPIVSQTTALDKDPARESGAGKSTLIRIEGTPQIRTSIDRYKRIPWQEESIRETLVDCSLDLYRKAPPQIILDFDTTNSISYGEH